MNFVGCDGAITTASDNTPSCVTGWYVLTPSQLTNELGLDSSATALTPDEYSELWGGLVLILMLGFSARIVKKMFLPNV